MHYLTLLHNILSFSISIVLVCLFMSYFRLFSYIFAFQKLTGLSVAMDPWTFHKTIEDDHTCKYKLYNDDRPMSVKHALNLMYNSKRFRSSFIKELVDAPFEAYFFETPPVSADNYEHLDFEFVLVNSKSLSSRRANAAAFQEHFNSDCMIATFPNIGKDATMVAPCPIDEPNRSHYVNLAAFMRNCNSEQVHQLWRSVAYAMVERVQHDSRRTWLSTSGLGVDWLHVRLDSRPKYYTYTGYMS